MSNVFALELIMLNKVFISITISQPKIMYSTKDNWLNRLLLKILNIVPIKDNARTAIKIGIPE